MSARILMCRPEHYGIEYEINPWMDRHKGSDPETSRRQWNALRETLTDLGASVEEIDPVPGLPDLVFTANAGLVFHNLVLVARFRHGVRQGETPLFDAWFQERGFDVEHLPHGLYFEGAGDALFCGETLFAGYRVRSDARAPAMGRRPPRRRGPPPGTRRPPLLSSRHLLLPPQRNLRPLLPRRLRRIRPVRAQGPGPGVDRGLRRRGRHLQLQRRRRRPLGGAQRGRLETSGITPRSRFFRVSFAVNRVHQVRRKCQVPDASVGRRGSRRVETRRDDSRLMSQDRHEKGSVSINGHPLPPPPRHRRRSRLHGIRRRRPPPHPQGPPSRPPGRLRPRGPQDQARPDHHQPVTPRPPDGRDRRRRPQAPRAPRSRRRPPAPASIPPPSWIG